MLKRILKWLWGTLEILIIIYVVFITSCILCRNSKGFTQFDKYVLVTINEENHQFLPDYKEGDLVIIKNQQHNLEVGNVIYFYVTSGEKYVVRSGAIVEKVNNDYDAVYTIDGLDSKVSATRVIGREASTSSKVGRILEVLESQFGFLFLVLLPILLVFIYQIYQLVVVAKYDTVDDDVSEKSTDEKVQDDHIAEVKSNDLAIEQNEIKDVQEEIKKETTDTSDDVELL